MKMWTCTPPPAGRAAAGQRGGGGGGWTSQINEHKISGVKKFIGPFLSPFLFYWQRLFVDKGKWTDTSL